MGRPEPRSDPMDCRGRLQPQAAARTPSPPPPSHPRRFAVQSAATRGVTVVTIVTLFFTPVMKGHKWHNVLTGKSEETKIVQCDANDKHCPKKQTITQ